MKLRYKLLLLPLILMATTAFADQKKSDFTLKSVVIDAGHGGKDPGALSPDKKTRESDLTLKIAKLLAEKIRNNYPDVKVGMTRESDKFIELIDRAKIATRQNADLFISIHINAAKKSTAANGFSVYILGQSADKSKDTYAFNMEVVARENSVIYLEEDYSTKYAEDNSPEAQILKQFMYNAFREQSLLFAEAVDDEMKSGPFRKSLGVHQANICVLRQASMPAVLLELGFLSNADDLKTLRKPETPEALAEKIFQAFRTYKTNYDRSVSTSADTAPAEAPAAKPAAPADKPAAAPAPQTKTPETKPATQPEPAAPAAKAADKPQDPVTYGVQVMASSKLISATDKMFKGYPCEVFKIGTLYKYVLVLSEDKTAVAKSYVDISKSFPGCFCVKVENEELVRCNIK